MNNLYAFLAGFLGTGVEFVEALTVILAVGLVRGWKHALLGTLSAVIVLAVLVAVVGAPLAQVFELEWVRIAVGLAALLFGIRWLRKAILRYAGLKALHDEEKAFREELERQKLTLRTGRGFDQAAFMAAFGITFLEGLEAIFIVITFGLSLHSMSYTIGGAVLATVLVIAAGIAVRKPLAKVPENTMKFVIGIMLTSFGLFWVGEGIGVDWPQADLSIIYVAASLLAFSYLLIRRCKSSLQGTADMPNKQINR